MPSHQEILVQLEKEKKSYTEKLTITLGVLILLILAFFAIKVFSPDL